MKHITAESYILRRTRTSDQMQAFLHYALSLDYILNKDIDTADKEFDAAVSLDHDEKYKDFFSSYITSVENS